MVKLNLYLLLHPVQETLMLNLYQSTQGFKHYEFSYFPSPIRLWNELLVTLISELNYDSFCKGVNEHYTQLVYVILIVYILPSLAHNST